MQGLTSKDDSYYIYFIAKYPNNLRLSTNTYPKNTGIKKDLPISNEKIFLMK